MQRCTIPNFIYNLLGYNDTVNIILNFSIAITAVKNGDPNSLLNPTDYLGNTCGQLNIGKNNPYTNQTDKPYV
jgi:hypothetical protein